MRKRLIRQSKLRWATAIVLALIAGTAAWNLRPSPATSALAVGRFSHVLPEGQQFTIVGSPLVALSPDGSRMVYVANQQFYLMAMDTLESSPIPGSDVDPSDPFFSPDGAWIGYWSESDSQLKKIAVSGGVPVTLTDTAGDPLGRPVWGADETIVWGQNERVLRVFSKWGDSRSADRGLRSGAYLWAPDSARREIGAVPSRGSRSRRRRCAVAGIWREKGPVPRFISEVSTDRTPCLRVR